MWRLHHTTLKEGEAAQNKLEEQDLTALFMTDVYSMRYSNESSANKNRTESVSAPVAMWQLPSTLRRAFW
jgi:hypothetical protein